MEARTSSQRRSKGVNVGVLRAFFKQKLRLGVTAYLVQTIFKLFSDGLTQLVQCMGLGCSITRTMRIGALRDCMQCRGILTKRLPVGFGCLSGQLDLYHNMRASCSCTSRVAERAHFPSTRTTCGKTSKSVLGAAAGDEPLRVA